MKKLILSAAIVLGSLTTMSAQEQTPATDQNTVPTEQTTPATDQTAPATEQATQTTGAFNEIKSDQVPSAVSESLKKAYPDAEMTKAYMNDKKEYKLEVKMGDKEGAVYTDENGKWIKNN